MYRISGGKLGVRNSVNALSIKDVVWVLIVDFWIRSMSLISTLHVDKINVINVITMYQVSQKIGPFICWISFLKMDIFSGTPCIIDNRERWWKWWPFIWNKNPNLDWLQGEFVWLQSEFERRDFMGFHSFGFLQIQFKTGNRNVFKKPLISDACRKL